MTLPTDELFVQHLLDHLSEGVIGLTQEGQCTFANATAGELLKFDVTTVDGKPMHNLFADVDGDGTPYTWSDSPIGYACRRNQPYQGEREKFNNGDDTLEVTYHCVPAPRLEGSVTDMLLVFRPKSQGKEGRRSASLTDPVTGLGGLALFEVMLKKAVSRAQRRQGRVGVLYVDLVGFKAMNEKYGADACDSVLKETAARLEKCIRGSDSVMRVEGDVFGIIAEDVDTTLGTIPLAERIIAAQERAFHFEGNEIHLRTAIGIAVYPDHGWDDKDLQAKAMKATEDAKGEKMHWKMAQGDI